MAAFREEMGEEKENLQALQMFGSSDSGSGGMAHAKMASLTTQALLCRQVSKARNFRNLRHFALFSES